MSRLMDADELIEHVWREDLNTREKIANLVERMPTASDWDRYSKKLWKEAYERGKRDAQSEVAKDINVPSTDCISRQQAIDALKNRWKKTRNYEGIGDDIAEECELYLKQVPSAQPERKKGHWIEVDDHYNRISGRCSACGWESHLYEDDVVGMNFCPNCGADMRGEQDE